MFLWITLGTVAVLLIWGTYTAYMYPALELAILTTLGEKGATEGRQLRQYLNEKGFHLSGARFYHIMARLENAKYVEGWYERMPKGKYTIRSRWYRLKEGGRRAQERRLARALLSAFPIPV